MIKVKDFKEVKDLLDEIAGMDKLVSAAALKIGDHSYAGSSSTTITKGETSGPVWDARDKLHIAVNTALRIYRKDLIAILKGLDIEIEETP